MHWPLSDWPKPRRTVPYRVQLGMPSPSVPTGAPSLSFHWGCRNINRLAIGCPIRVPLRSRLTLGRLALPRNPWIFGVLVSRQHYRYLCLHLLFRALHTRSRCMLRRTRNAPLPIDAEHLFRFFGSALYARLLSMHCRSTSELLRTL